MPKCFKCGKNGKHLAKDLNIPIISTHTGVKYVTLPMPCNECLKSFRQMLQDWYGKQGE